MPNQDTDAENALQKLGQRIRAGWANQHPVPDQSLATVRTTVREEWEQEQQAKAKQPAPDATKEKGREPEEPDLGR